jgi:hypothetical protein
VRSVNADLPDAPDFSHLEYCAQAQASSDQIARIASTIKDLQTLAGQAASYKRLLVPLDKMRSRPGRHLRAIDESRHRHRGDNLRNVDSTVGAPYGL